MKISKTLFLASASVLVLGLGAPSTAQAFDNIEWNWNNDVNSSVDVDIDVTDTLDVSGLVQIEKIQMNIGDVTAISTVEGINNNPPGSAEGTVTANFNTEIDLTAEYDDNAANNPITDVVINSAGLTGSNGAGNVNNNGGNTVNMTFDLDGQVEVDLSEVTFEGINDAVDLPEVTSAATAVANNQSLSSTVSMNLNDAQYNFGGFSGFFEDAPTQRIAAPLNDSVNTEGANGNLHTDILLGATLAGALGIITPGEVSATSSVTDITNASVDSSATAVANNLTVDLQANTVGDAFLIADLNQFNYADVSATSSVTDVTVNNYANLGALDGALVNSIATAVGNNVSITVDNSAVAVNVQ